MIVMERDEVLSKLDMGVCISLMREAFEAMARGLYVQPPRTIHTLPRGNLFGFMPAYLGDGDCFGAKVLDAYMTNEGSDFPSHMGYVMLFEAVHGQPVGLADAGAITQVRTGAVSALATDLLARKDARHLALVGAGAQARSHLEAIRLVRKIDYVSVFDVSLQAARRFADEAERRFHVPVQVYGCAQEAVADADIICTLTPSKEPVIRLADVAAGVHVNAVGTFSPDKREVASDLVAAARLYADDVEAMKRESGGYLLPLAEGAIEEGHVIGSIGDLLLGRVEGRRSKDEITLFDALGLAAEDVICARWLLHS